MNKDNTVIYFGEDPSYPPTSTFQRRTAFLTPASTKICALILFVLLIVYAMFPWRGASPESTGNFGNNHYTYQESYQKYTKESDTFKFAVISDMDRKSKVEDKNLWQGILKTGTLIKDSKGMYTITWEETRQLTSQYNEGGRGMELSELVYFHNRLLTCDDRTGIILEITESNAAIPIHVLSSGNGKQEKGFKCEWMTVKGDVLYVGSIGKEYTRGKDIINNDSTWVKTIDTEGRIKHVPWNEKYQILRKMVGAEYPGYLLHEAVNWNSKTNKWIFLPRRFSTEAYDEEIDEKKGTNIVLTASEDFSVISQNSVGELDPLRGVSSFKFLPFRDSEVVALKTIEYKDRVESYITVYNLDTLQVLMDDVKIDNIKFEGVEIL